jgi:hypothetical protein
MCNLCAPQALGTFGYQRIFDWALSQMMNQDLISVCRLDDAIPVMYYIVSYYRADLRFHVFHLHEYVVFEITPTPPC